MSGVKKDPHVILKDFVVFFSHPTIQRGTKTQYNFHVWLSLCQLWHFWVKESISVQVNHDAASLENDKIVLLI